MRLAKQTIVLGKEHKDLVVKCLHVDLKPTEKNDEPVTIHFFIWTGKTFKRLARKDVPTWAKTFNQHYRISAHNRSGLDYNFKGDRAMQPYHGDVTVVEG